MKKLVAFDLDGTLALSKQPLDEDMAGRIADLLDVCLVDIISGGDWPQFEKQVVSRLPERAKLANLFIQPTPMIDMTMPNTFDANATSSFE
jgi:hypothetical protein